MGVIIKINQEHLLPSQLCKEYEKLIIGRENEENPPKSIPL